MPDAINLLEAALEDARARTERARSAYEFHVSESDNLGAKIGQLIDSEIELADALAKLGGGK